MEDALARLAIADPKSVKPATQFVQQQKGMTGAFLLTIKSDAKVYHYDVEIMKKSSNANYRDKPLSKKGPDDGEASLRRILCLEIMNYFKEKTQNFGLGAKGASYVYDGGKNLYLVAPMKVEAGKKTLQFQSTDLSPFAKKHLSQCSLTIEVTPSATNHEICLAKISTLLGTREGPGDRSIAQFIDLLTSHFSIASTSHVSLGLGSLFRRAGRVMDRNSCIELKAGISKGVTPIMKDGKPALTMIVDAKEAAFFTANCLADIIGQRNPRSLSSFYAGVRACLSYAMHRTIVIDAISERKPSNVTVGDMPMVQFYKTRYNISIKPQLNLIQTNGALYPMDTVIILPNQRLPNEKLDEAVSTAIIRSNAVLPQERFNKIREEAKAAKLIPANPLMQFFGISIATELQTVNMGIRAPPTLLIMNRGKQENMNTRDGAWKSNQFIGPSVVLAKGMVVFYPQKMNLDGVKAFYSQLKSAASQRGLTLPEPIYELMDFSSYASMTPLFDAYCKKVKAAIAIDDKFNKSHHNLKLLEKEKDLLTMQITMQTAQTARTDTLKNLVKKLNAKAGGLNEIPIIEPCANVLSLKGNVLVIGIDISLPSRATAKQLFDLGQKDLKHISSYDPAIVGVAGNFTANYAQIIGGYYYQEASHEVLNPELLKKKMVHVVSKFVEKRGAFPEHVVILRDGVGEGQRHKTTQAEYPVIEEACKEVKVSKGANALPAITYIIVTKKHNKRFVTGTPGNEANCVPGTVVDKDIVRPDIQEFYLQSHRPIKGTAKSAHFAIMMNPKNLSMDVLQAFCNHLAYSHQIVDSAISLPEPVYYAKEMCKRGRNNLNAKKAVASQPMPRQPNGLVNLDILNNKLTYDTNGLANVKFAA